MIPDAGGRCCQQSTVEEEEEEEEVRLCEETRGDRGVRGRMLSPTSLSSLIIRRFTLSPHLKYNSWVKQSRREHFHSTPTHLQ